MEVMQIPLKILTVAGCRPPISWSSACKRTMYNVYTIVMFLLLFTFMLPQIVDLVLNVDNPDAFTDTFYIMLAMVIAFCKMLSLIMNRKNIEMLSDALVEKPFKPLEKDEIKIRRKYNNAVWKCSVLYTILIEIACGGMNLISLLTDFRKGNLAYREWTPWKKNITDTVYYLTYFRQLMGLTVASIVNVACDITVCGFLLHIEGQFKILECRVKKSLRNQGDLGECVRLHDHIYKFARTINEKFRIIIAVQFIASMLVICFNLYQLAMTSLSAKYIPLILYTTGMLVQIFLYCWFGNEVKLKSIQFADEIFGMDWVTADKKVRKSLIIIINRCLLPIEFSSAYMVTVNLDSFVKLLKMSYSVYNILQRTEEEQ